MEKSRNQNALRNLGKLLGFVVMIALISQGLGCASLDKMLLNGHETVSPVVVTNQVPVETRTTQAAVTTAADGSVATNYTVLVSTNVVPQVRTNFVTNTVYELKPAITQVAQGIQTANSLANPTPSAPMVNLGIEAGLALLAGYVSLRNKKYAAATKAIIQGVETAASASPALAPVKDAIADSALDSGVADFVAALVDKHTASMATIAPPLPKTA